MELKTGIQYQIGCQDCSATYVGQTGRTLAQRLNKHKSALTNAHADKSAVQEHATNKGHHTDWSNMHIRESCYATVLAEMHPGDLACVKPPPPPQPGGRHSTTHVQSNYYWQQSM